MDRFVSGNCRRTYWMNGFRARSPCSRPGMTRLELQPFVSHAEARGTRELCCSIAQQRIHPSSCPRPEVAGGAYQNVMSGHPRHVWRQRAPLLSPAATDAQREAAATPRPPTEIKMQKAVFSILGALLIAGATVQMAAASEHHTRTGRVHHRWDRAYDQVSAPGSSIPQTRKPVASETRSCDILWCYPD